MAGACSNAVIVSNQNIFWTGAGDGVTWLDPANWWEEDANTPNYAIPGWWWDNPNNPSYSWNYDSNKAYAIFNNGGTIILNNLPDGRIERLFIGGPTNTTVTLATTLPIYSVYKLYVGCSGDIGTLNIPEGTGITDPEASSHCFGWCGIATINITGGTWRAINKGTYLGSGPGAVGTVNLSSGEFICGDNLGGTLYIGLHYGTGSIIQTGGNCTGWKIFLPGDTKIVGEEKARGLYEISAGTLRAEEYLLMDDDGEGTLRIIGTEPIVQLQRIDMKQGYGHKLEFVLSSTGVSQIDVFGNKTLGDTDQGADVHGEIVMKAQTGVTVNINDTFDVIKSAAFINNSGMTVTSEIDGIEFVPSIVQVADANVLRLTAIEAAPRCGDLAHPYPSMDFSGIDGNKDCIVNVYDMAEFATGWMERSN
jgi:hypothetical protein